MTTTLVLLYAAAAAVLSAIVAGIPMRMIRRHPDTAPDTALPEYLRADWESILAQGPAGPRRRPGR